METKTPKDSFAYLALVRLLPGVDQEVLLQVSQLGEAFVAGLAFERSLAAVDTKMHLQPRRKTEEDTTVKNQIAPLVRGPYFEWTGPSP